jgi:hypothetical protein
VTHVKARISQPRLPQKKAPKRGLTMATEKKAVLTNKRFRSSETTTEAFVTPSPNPAPSSQASAADYANQARSAFFASTKESQEFRPCARRDKVVENTPREPATSQEFSQPSIRTPPNTNLAPHHLTGSQEATASHPSGQQTPTSSQCFPPSRSAYDPIATGHSPHYYESRTFGSVWNSEPDTGAVTTQSTPVQDERSAHFSNGMASWKRTKHQEEKSQRRAFVHKKDNPFSRYKHDPNDAESYLDVLSKTQSPKDSIIPPEGLRALENAYRQTARRMSQRPVAQASQRRSFQRGRRANRNFSTGRMSNRQLLAQKAAEQNAYLSSPQHQQLPEFDNPWHSQPAGGLTPLFPGSYQPQPHRAYPDGLSADASPYLSPAPWHSVNFYQDSQHPQGAQSFHDGGGQFPETWNCEEALEIPCAVPHEYVVDQVPSQQSPYFTDGSLTW